MVQENDRVYMYVLADSESSIPDNPVRVVWHGPGTVCGVVRTLRAAHARGDCQIGDVIIRADDPEEQVLHPHGRAFTPQPHLGPHVYEEQAYGGYWAQLIIFPLC